MLPKFKKNLIFLLCTILWLSSSVIANAEEMSEQSLFATSAVLLDAESGRVLYSKNGDNIMAMASTTKIMTCIVTLENATNLEEQVEISSYATTMPKVKLYVNKGETYTLRDLLYSLMLESHNDSAAAIAEHIGKQYLSDELRQKNTSEYTVEESKKALAAFAALMNQKAEEIGCENTWFITPNGLDATETITLPNGETIMKEHSTTATDLANIMAYCILRSPMKDAFLEITRTSSYTFSNSSGRSYSCSNHNAFLNMMDGALSGKTGFTNKAGYCYVGSLQRDGKTFVVALLACGWPNNKSYKWSDTKLLMKYGLENYTYHAFSEVEFKEEELKSIPVLGGKTKRIGQIAFTELEIAERNETLIENEGELEGLLLKEGENFQVVSEMKEVLEAPVVAGQEIGTIQYMLNDKVYKTEHIIICQSVEKIDIKWCFLKVWEIFSI